MIDPTDYPEPAWVTLDEWCRRSGDNRSAAYTKLGDGRLRAVKDGKRLKIDLQHGLAHMRSLPSVTIKPAKKPAVAALDDAPA